MFSGIHLYALIYEMQEFIEKPVYGLRKKDQKIYINTGKRGIFLSLYSGKPFISIGKIEGTNILTSILSGIRIKRINQLGLDRILQIILEDGISVFIEVKATNGNIVITKDGEIEWVLRREEKRGIYPGEKYIISEQNGINPIEEEIDMEKNIQGISKGLKKWLLKIPDTSLRKFFQNLRDKRFSPVVYMDRNIPVLVLPTKIDLDLEEKDFSYMYEALNFYYETIFQIEKQEREKRQAIAIIKKKIKGIESEIERLNKKEDYEKFKIMGEAILYNRDRIKKGEKIVSLPNPYNPEEKIEIELNLKMDITGNANLFFKKYKKAKSLSEKRTALLQKLSKEKEKLEKNIKRIEEGEVLHIEERENKVSKKGKFREFKTSHGFLVLAGKDAKTNELLLKEAGKFDLFFHVRGSPGGFVIIKRENKNTPVPHKDIEEAASIAAYFSKQKHSNLVPVSYTEARYVRKPKNAKPGLVLLTKEKVIFVHPEIKSDLHPEDDGVL